MTIEEKLDTVIKKIDILIKLTAINSLHSKNLTQKIGILSEMGLDNTEISQILDSDKDTVKTLKSRYKKKRE